jgi:ABC-type transporter MlaC component
MRQILFAAFAILFSTPAAHAAAEAGKERTEALISAFKKVKTEGGKSLSTDKAFADLDAFFDFGVLAKKPIEPVAAKLKPEELSRFQTQFRELIRLVAYPNAGDFFRKAKLTFQPERKEADLVAVPLKLHVPEEDLDLSIEFRWAAGPKGLRIVDVLFDGDSLIKDYQNQVAKIVNKSGAPGLFKVLGDRRAELEKGK